MAPLQIIGAGFGRTSTDSLRQALNILGYNTHHMKSMLYDPEQDLDDFYFAAKNNNDGNWDKIYANYDAAVDWPTCTFYKQLMAKYPDAKVILTVRSADSWYQSCKKTLIDHYTHPDFVGEWADKFRRMTSEVILKGAFNDRERANEEEKIKQMFLDHNEEVRNYVPPEKLYIMQMGEGWDGLCKFLDKKVPGVPYPKSNSSEDFVKSMLVFREKLIKS